MNLSKNIKVTQCLAYADGTSSRDGAELDMEGWDGVLAVICLHTQGASAVGDFHWEQDTATGMGSAADLEGTAMVTGEGDDDEVWVSDLYRPRERFVRGVITKDASHSQAENVVYIQYRGRKLPVTDAGADAFEFHASPAEGTK